MVHYGALAGALAILAPSLVNRSRKEDLGEYLVVVVDEPFPKQSVEDAVR